MLQIPVQVNVYRDHYKQVWYDRCKSKRYGVLFNVACYLRQEIKCKVVKVGTRNVRTLSRKPNMVP